jgi:hypothetical protein
MFMNEKQTAHWNSLGFSLDDLFKPLLELELDYVKNQTKENLALTNHIASLNELYESIQQDVIKIDTSLGDHAKNLSIQAQKKLALLEVSKSEPERITSSPVASITIPRSSVLIGRVERLRDTQLTPSVSAP